MNKLILLAAAIILIYFVTTGRTRSECNTYEDLESIGIELQDRMLEIVSDGDFNKVKIIRQHEPELLRIQEILESAEEGQDYDYQAVCVSIDNLLNDL